MKHVDGNILLYPWRPSCVLGSFLLEDKYQSGVERGQLCVQRCAAATASPLSTFQTTDCGSAVFNRAPLAVTTPARQASETRRKHDCGLGQYMVISAICAFLTFNTQYAVRWMQDDRSTQRRLCRGTSSVSFSYSEALHQCPFLILRHFISVLFLCRRPSSVSFFVLRHFISVLSCTETLHQSPFLILRYFISLLFLFWGTSSVSFSYSEILHQSPFLILRHFVSVLFLFWDTSSVSFSYSEALHQCPFLILRHFISVLFLFWGTSSVSFPCIETPVCETDTSLCETDTSLCEADVINRDGPRPSLLLCVKLTWQNQNHSSLSLPSVKRTLLNPRPQAPVVVSTAWPLCWGVRAWPYLSLSPRLARLIVLHYTASGPLHSPQHQLDRLTLNTSWTASLSSTPAGPPHSPQHQLDRLTLNTSWTASLSTPAGPLHSPQHQLDRLTLNTSWTASLSSTPAGLPHSPQHQLDRLTLNTSWTASHSSTPAGPPHSQHQLDRFTLLNTSRTASLSTPAGPLHSPQHQPTASLSTPAGPLHSSTPADRLTLNTSWTASLSSTPAGPLHSPQHQLDRFTFLNTSTTRLPDR